MEGGVDMELGPPRLSIFQVQYDSDMPSLLPPSATATAYAPASRPPGDASRRLIRALTQDRMRHCGMTWASPSYGAA
ncbi:hypothetical protein B0H13DRAFT_2654928, partial [Mycena leptocephala]